jgi:ribosomal-protein-alanine N-acetyltransferase
MCMNCENFDYCENCEKEKTHNIKHVFLKSKYKILTKNFFVHEKFYLEDKMKIELKDCNYDIEKNEFKNNLKKEIKEYNIRLSNIDDIERIVEIEKESFDSPYSKKLFLFYLRSDSDRIFVFEINSKVEAYYMICADSSTQVTIASIAVSKNYRNNGIGKLLIDYIIKQVKDLEFKKLSLHVNVKNIPAQKIYSKFGFKTIEWIDNYYSNIKTDALFMSLDL